MSKKLNKLQLMSDPAVAAIQNIRTYDYYFMRLSNIAVSIFEWKNLPETVDPRYLELALMSDGRAVFFKDEVMGYLALRCMIGGRWNVYDIPTERTAYAVNGYQNRLNPEDSVIIYNNMIYFYFILKIKWKDSSNECYKYMHSPYDFDS